MMKAAKASQNLGLTALATFSGALAWPFVYPWPQRPSGLVEDAFEELAKRWKPILDQFDNSGVDVCYEIHPGEDLHDGVTYEMFLERVGNHSRCCMLYDPSHYVLQHLNYLDNIDIYHEKIKIFSKLSGYGFDGWAVLEWECCIKSPEQGAEEGSKFIQDHIIEITEKAFDDFADSGIDKETNKKLLGIK